MPPAARIADMHTCPMVNPGPVPHVGGPVCVGSGDVFIGFMPAARVGDKAICVPGPDTISAGSGTVEINHKQAARLGDSTAHGGVIVVGCPTVIIGDSPQSFALTGAAASGQPFCEECEKARKALEEKQKQQAASSAEGSASSSASTPAAAAAPADKPRITLEGVTPHEVEIAKAPGTSPEQRAARQSIASKFYEQHGLVFDRGTQEHRLLDAAEVRSHVKGIDLDKPVSFGPPPALPPALHQWQMPGYSQGQYFAHANATPDGLGIHHSGNKGPGAPLEKKVQTPYDMEPGGAYLTSTAAPIDDHWSERDASGKGILHPTQGGAQQFYVPGTRNHAKQKKS
jgi:uncharacterized Zn-binding protein involved in type VI secretion